MGLDTVVSVEGLELTQEEKARIRFHLQRLDRRVAHQAGPTATLTLSRTEGQLTVVATLRLRMGPVGPYLQATESAASADRAVDLVVRAVEVQLPGGRGNERPPRSEARNCTHPRTGGPPP